MSRVHETVRELETKYPTHDFPTEKLMSKLESSVAADEFIQLRRIDKVNPNEEITPATILSRVIKRKKNNNPAPAKSANDRQTTNTMSSCLFCSKKHCSKDFKTYPSFVTRRQWLLELKRCTICFSVQHDNRGCKARDRECRECHHEGHQSPMCVKYMKEVEQKMRNSQAYTPEWKEARPHNLKAMLQ